MKISSVLVLWLVSFIALANPSSQPAKITHLHISQNNNQTKLALNLTDTLSYKVFALPHPDRVVIDLSPATSLLKTPNKSIFDNTIFTTMRVGGAASTHTVRLVFDLKIPIRQMQMKLEPQKGKNKQLVIALTPDKSSNMQSTANTANSTDPVKVPSKKISALTEADQIIKEEVEPVVSMPIKKRDVIVVIDPGHGGKDPGATGRGGTREKDIVLAISRRLQALINQQPGMHAVLTRRGDYYIGLRERLRLARKDRADMFIAIHADAYRNSYASGSSVFALSASGASSEAARWLAEKENYSELGGVNLDDKGDVLRSVLLDLSQTATISLSLQLGSSLLNQLSMLGRLHHGSVEQARFVVLKSPDIPSVLVETGFISNTEEEARLRNPAFQERLAESLMQGIRRYFTRNAPPGTIFAVQHNRNRERQEKGQ